MTKPLAMMGAIVATLFAATASQAQFRLPEQPIEEQFNFLAGGLTPSYITRNAGQDIDQFALLPIGSEEPTHIIACIEERLESLDGSTPPFTFGDKLIPGVQRINLTTGEVETIVRGMTICDGIRTTPWGTVLATEEDFVSDTGSVYEILDPFTTDEYTILERGLGGQAATIVDQTGADPVADGRIAKRTQLPVIRYEGFVVGDTGVVIAGDEERPGSYRPDSDGGAIYKYIPNVQRDPEAGFVTALADSPLAGTGTTYAAQVTCTGGIQFGQGCEVGEFNWIELSPQLAEVGAQEGLNRIGREAANDAGASAFYRPEDMHFDPTFDPAASGFGANAAKFCFAATGRRSSDQFGEVICVIDFDITGVNESEDDGQMNRFVEGDEDMNQPDNLAFQPKTGILYVIEDNPNGDVWACLPDGADRDLKSDGCVRVLTLADPSSEPTGFIFTPDGANAVFAIQHSGDDLVPLFDDFRTDDLVLLNGFGRTSSLDWGARVQRLLERSDRRLFGYDLD